MSHDPWLERWLPLISKHAGSHPVLELGCGSGADTISLLAAGLAVVAIDRSSEAVRLARNRAPGATFHVQDILDPFPPEATGTGVIVSSLSLHYFRWIDTIALVERIRHTLGPDGLLVCRVNSTEDTNFGAAGHPELERNFYMVDGGPKRFFDRDDLVTLFASGWTMLSLEHRTTAKYGPTKSLWELICTKSAA